ncbi:MAG: hypothetical protein ABIV25_01165 [Paracoccaceae bacterium]
MSDPSANRLSSGGLFQIVKYAAVVLIALKSLLVLPKITNILLAGDNDDMMRLMSVRAWLDGQSWFDMTQYRILPPEGISMHWSRLLDFLIATIIVPASWFVPMAQAEQIGLVAWPAVLLAVLVILVANGTNRIFGALAAYFAIICLFLWPPIASLYFRPGRIDHHNVQVLMMTLVAFNMVWQGRPLVRGAVAGIAAAFSLAVGLEMMALVVVAGSIMTVRASFGMAEANRLLAAFCTTLTAASALFFVAQTGSNLWLVPQCDALAMPVLSVTVIAACACLIPMAAQRWLSQPALRLLATIVVASLGLWIFWPLLQPCLAGPYGKLPPEVQKLMSTRITEAQPGLVFLMRQPFAYNSTVTPVAGAIVLAIVFWIRRTWLPAETVQRNAVLQMILLGSVGLIGSFFQIRAIGMAACAVPFLTGFVFQSLVQLWTQRPKFTTAVVVVLCAFATLLAPQLNDISAQVVRATGGTDALKKLRPEMLDASCDSLKSLTALNALPKARILTTLNFGAPLILVTHHDGLSAPYHRSAAAFSNGIFPFETAANMQSALTSTGADYVLLCRKTNYGGDLAIANGLLHGEMVAGLTPFVFESDDFALFKAPPTTATPNP